MFLASTTIRTGETNMSFSRASTLMVSMILLATASISFSDGGLSSNANFEGATTGRAVGMESELIFDELVEVPPGGETRIDFGKNRDTVVSGYAGISYFNYGKLGEAASLLPQWLRTPFMRNMIMTASDPISQGPGMKPAFGDLDGDGDEDLVAGYEGDLYYYENVGWEGNPILIPAQDDMIDYINQKEYEWICPSLMDLNLDGICEIVYGTQREELQIAFLETGQLSGLFLPAHLEPFTCPTLFDVRNISVEGGNREYEYILICGDRRGEIYTFRSVVREENGSWNGFQLITGETPDITGIPPSLNHTAPLRWYHNPNLDHPYPDLVVGSGEGTLRYYSFQSFEDDSIQYSRVMGYFDNILHRGPIRPAGTDLDGDRQDDIVLGCGEKGLPKYVNLQWFLDMPYWAPGPTTPSFNVENYLSGFDSQMKFYNEEIIEGLLDSIIDPPNPSYRDEIGYACAYTPPHHLRQPGMDSLLLENAFYIYSRDGGLEYVRLKEYTGPDGYTTAVYRIRSGDRIREMEIPRDAYYQGIVHPRVTEERVAYIDPDTGNVASKSEGGRFWREYLYSHADPEYPPGPEYPDDWTGRRVSYPVEFKPPRLSDVLKDTEILWDLMPYNYPKGIDDDGKNNGHPWDYRDHAIEKVSNWVEKTLPINQQESPDDERPNQPVRIAATHNGNCGELQDLTIAAARSALIPARGILMPGEDHVWSEFYLGGWHQWDNYWSDGGGVVADNMNYWWGWGERGGSGLMATLGDGEVEDVGDNYRPSDVTGSLEVNVVDNSGLPVDGARVMVLSHWLMEQTDVSVGPYQGPPPATVPMPSIWGYTDQSGICSLNVWHQNFHVRVVSDLGTFVSDKFTIGDQETMELRVQLEGEMPRSRNMDLNLPNTHHGSKYLVHMEAEGGYQIQSDFYSGVVYREEVDYVALIGEIEVGNGSDPELLLNGELGSGKPISKSFPTGGENVTIVLNSTSSIRTYSRVRVKIFALEEFDGEQESILLLNGKYGMENGGDDILRGVVLNPVGEIKNLSMSGLENNPFVTIEESISWTDWVLYWSCSNLLGIPDQVNPVSLRIDYREEDTVFLPFTVLIKDSSPPVWGSTGRYSEYPWGSKALIRTSYPDETEETDHLAWIGLTRIGGDSIDGYWDPDTGLWTVDTSDIPSGRRQFRSSAVDPSGNVQTLRFNIDLIPQGPNITVITPVNGSLIEGDYLEITGRVTDDVSISEFTISYLDKSRSLMGDLTEEGEFSSEVDIRGLTGDMELSFGAVDNMELSSVENVSIKILPPPDRSSPTVDITAPREGESIERGEEILVRGTAGDDRMISSLILTTPEGDLDLLPHFDEPLWEVLMDTSDWDASIHDIGVTAMDGSGNRASDSVSVEIFVDTKDDIDRRDPELRITNPLQGDEFSLGDKLQLMGVVTDDVDVVSLEFSIDRGYTTRDITGSIDAQGGFSVEIDTDDIPPLLDIDPSLFRSVLEDYPIMVYAVDSSGKDDYQEVRIMLDDVDDPKIRSLQTVTEGIDTINIDLSVSDNTALEKVIIRMLDPDGIYILERTLEGNSISRDGDLYLVSLEIPSPAFQGIYEVEVTAFDPWGNSATEVGLVKMKGGGDSGEVSEFNYGMLLAIAGTLLFLFIAVYLAVRFSRRSSP